MEIERLNGRKRKEFFSIRSLIQKYLDEEYCADFVTFGNCFAAVSMGLFLEVWAVLKFRGSCECCGKYNLCARF